MPFRQMSCTCTGVVPTKNMIKTEFVHRGCAHEKRHSDRFRARGVRTKTPFRLISCTGVVRTKSPIKTDFVHRVDTKNVIQIDFVPRACAHKKKSLR